jgi:predicted membrane protein
VIERVPNPNMAGEIDRDPNKIHSPKGHLQVVTNDLGKICLGSLLEISLFMLGCGRKQSMSYSFCSVTYVWVHGAKITGLIMKLLKKFDLRKNKLLRSVQ